MCDKADCSVHELWDRLQLTLTLQRLPFWSTALTLAVNVSSAVSWKPMPFTSAESTTMVRCTMAPSLTEMVTEVVKASYRASMTLDPRDVGDHSAG